MQSALSKAFESVYVQPCDDSLGREARRDIFAACFAEFEEESCTSELWFNPGTWPTPLSVEAYTADSASANANRDLSHVLDWAGKLVVTAVDVAEEDGTLAASCLRHDMALGVSALIPSGTLGDMLLGRSTPKPFSVGDPHQAAIAATSLGLALQIFMERGAGHYIHQSWAASMLTQCAKLVKELVVGSAADMRCVNGTDVGSHLTDAMQCLAAYFSNALLSSTPKSPRLVYLRPAICIAVALQRVAAQSAINLPEASKTLLQLSCWRFENPGSRSKLPAPHVAVDWLWPFFTAAQTSEEVLLGPSSSVAWSDDALGDKVGLFFSDKSLQHSVYG